MRHAFRDASSFQNKRRSFSETTSTEGNSAIDKSYAYTHAEKSSTFIVHKSLATFYCEFKSGTLTTHQNTLKKAIRAHVRFHVCAAPVSCSQETVWTNHARVHVKGQIFSKCFQEKTTFSKCLRCAVV